MFVFSWQGKAMGDESVPGRQAHTGSARMSDGLAARVIGPASLRVASDLLIVWDMAVLVLVGYGCALAYAKMLQHQPGFLGLALRLSALVALLSAVWRLRPVSTRPDGGLRWSALTSAFGAVARLLALVLVVCCLAPGFAPLPWGWMLPWLACGSLAMFAGRLAGPWLWAGMLSRGFARERVAIINCDLASGALSDQVAQLQDAGVRVAALYDYTADASMRELERFQSQVMELGRQRRVDRIIFTGSLPDDARVVELVRRLKELDLEIGYYPTHSLAAAGPLYGPPPLVLVRRPIDPWGRAVKTVLDRTFAILLIVGLAPAIACIAIAIKLDSPGPVIFRQRRHGWSGTEFQIYKFRTMTWQPNSGTGEVQTRRGDNRVTRVGAFLRRTSLDELPQLFNVLNGTMSLVGPRPHPVAMRTEELRCEEIVEDYSYRHRVRPGITGWAQITGHRGATETMDQVRHRVRQDIYYIENWSLLFDLRIMLLTPYSLLFDRENAF